MGLITCYFDGCCEPTNPGGSMGLGAIIYEDEKILFQYAICIHKGEHGITETSNNVAEYLACMRIVKYLIENKMQTRNILMRGDSKLVVEQMNGNWNMNKGAYIQWAKKVQEQLNQFPKINFQWIPREENEKADFLSKQKMKERGVKFKIQPQ